MLFRPGRAAQPARQQRLRASAAATGSHATTALTRRRWPATVSRDTGGPARQQRACDTGRANPAQQPQARTAA